MNRIVPSLIIVLFSTLASYAQEVEKKEAEPLMTFERMGDIVRSLDENAQSNQNMLQLTVEDIPVLIITDTGADRMRAMVPIRSVEGMTPEEIMRVMQANFDTALDARYAIAQGRLWGVYIHPLSLLTKNQFISGLGQAVNVAKTYGTLFTGGSLNFGAGDSVPLQRQLIDDLLKKGDAI